MPTNFPYVSSDYFSEKYQPFELHLKKETIRKTTHLQFRNEIEYLYVLSGKGKIEINSEIASISQGDFIQLMPYHVHRFVFESNQFIKIYRIRFSLGLLLYTSTNQKNYLKSIHSIENALPVVRLGERSQNRLVFMCEELYFEKTRLDENLESFHISLISLISYIYYSHHNQLQSKKRGQSLGGILLQFIQFHHQEKLTIEKLAKEFGIKESEAKKELKELTGYSFKQLLNQVRIRNAVALTQFEELSANQIAKISGYQSEGAFYKQFKEIEGTTPERYRERSKLLGKVSSDILEIVLFMTEHALENITLNQLSKELNFSEKKINGLLCEVYQMTFHEYYHYLKMIMAKNLLIALPISINMISTKMGYEDVLTFSRQFKKVFGMTPTNFRKNYRKIIS